VALIVYFSMSFKLRNICCLFLDLVVRRTRVRRDRKVGGCH